MSECEMLRGNGQMRCAAVKGQATLSPAELELYCRSGAHESCPVYVARRSPGEGGFDAGPQESYARAVLIEQ